MKRSNSFKLLWQAVKESRQSMWVSIQVLVVLTLLLATIFYLAEYNSQAEEYNYWNSLVWAFTRYIGDPGEFSHLAPVTTTGRWMATLIGIVGILIFAVPAGLIGGAFTSAIENDQREKHLEEVGDRLVKAFRRKQDPATKFYCIPRHISAVTIQATKEMSEKDLIDAVRYNKSYRLRNLDIATTRGSRPQDQLVVETFFINRDYGACIDRNSNVTICCPTAVGEAGIGNFAYYVAAIGGFNYISKEVNENIDDANSFYFFDPDAGTFSPHKTLFFNDLKQLAKSGDDHWVIFLIETLNHEGIAFQFQATANSKVDVASTVINEAEFEELYHLTEQFMAEVFDMKVSLNALNPVGPKNVGVRIGGGKTLNAFTIRVLSELTVWDYRNIAVAKRFAEAINKSIGDKSTEMSPERITLMKEKGTGFQI